MQRDIREEKALSKPEGCESQQEDHEGKALLEAARGPRAECRRIRDKIRRKDLRTGHDPDGRAARLERVLAYVEEHFFEHSLNVASACREVGVMDHETGGALRAYTKYTLGQLIDKLRVDAANHLLLETRFKVVTIGHLVGFRTFSTFLRTYEAWMGETPHVTRQRHDIDPYAGVPFDFGNFVLLRRVGSGDLAPEETRALQEGLGELYPEAFGHHREVVPGGAGPELAMPVLDAEALERFQATELWPRLAELPFAEQRELVCGWTFWTPAPFKFLHRKAREEGRRDRKRGVEVARLALDSLDGNEDRLGRRVHELRAEGWAWFANAQRLNLDFVAAETSFRRAEGVLDAHDLRDAWVAGVFYFLKGTLRMFERRHDEALDLFDQALPPFETAGDVHFQVRTLLQRTAALSYGNRLDETEPTLRTAMVLLQAAPDDALSFQIAYTTTSSLVQAGDFDRAEAYFQATAGQIAGIEEPVWRDQFQWAKAKIDHGLGRLEAAEAKYLGSRRGFQAHDQHPYAAFVALDLSLLYSETSEIAKMLEIAPGICEFFESLRLYDETLAALQMLRDAIARTEVTADLLRELRSYLWQDPLATLI